MEIGHILSLLGGVAFFLYGMHAMGAGLKQVAGPKMESYLWKMSDTPLKGFLLGLLVAAVIQSSSATSVMAVSFVNAGMMGLAQAVTVQAGGSISTIALSTATIRTARIPTRRPASSPSLTSGSKAPVCHPPTGGAAELEAPPPWASREAQGDAPSRCATSGGRSKMLHLRRCTVSVRQTMDEKTVNFRTKK